MLLIPMYEMSKVMPEITIVFTNNTVPAQIERRRSNFRLGFIGEDFTK